MIEITDILARREGNGKCEEESRGITRPPGTYVNYTDFDSRLGPADRNPKLMCMM